MDGGMSGGRLINRQCPKIKKYTIANLKTKYKIRHKEYNDVREQTTIKQHCLNYD